MYIIVLVEYVLEYNDNAEDFPWPFNHISNFAINPIATWRNFGLFGKVIFFPALVAWTPIWFVAFSALVLAISIVFALLPGVNVWMAIKCQDDIEEGGFVGFLGVILRILAILGIIVDVLFIVAVVFAIISSNAH